MKHVKIAPCPYCGKRLGSKQAMDYHIENRVCRKDGDVSRETEPETPIEPRWRHRMQLGGAAIWVRK